MADSNAVAGAGRVTWQVAEAGEETALGFGWSGVTIEGEVSYVEASDRQQIDADKTVTLGNTNLPGPAIQTSRAKLVDIAASARSGVEFMKLIRVEPLLGIEIATVDLEVFSGGTQESDLTATAGISTGLRAALQPHTLVEFYGQYSFAYLFGGDADNKLSFSSKAEAGARLFPEERFGVFAAYREVLFFQLRDPDSSDSQLFFRGPIVGAELKF